MVAVINKRLILFVATFLLILYPANVFASEKQEEYVIVYDRLYEYASDSSDVLRQYSELKAVGKDVLLFQADKIETERIKKESIIIVVASSFDSIEKYNRILNILNDFNVIHLQQHQLLTTKDNRDDASFMIAIDRVYPFSDLNKIMDVAEELNEKGIKFIVTFMPVYDNYELEAFDTYIKVLQYISKKGGKLFIHYPVEHKDVRYNSDPRVGFEKAVTEFRKHGLDLDGIALPKDKMLVNIKVFDGLALPFILATETEVEIEQKIDLLKASEILNDYIIIQGIHIDHFDNFHYLKENQLSDQQVIYISANEEKEKLFNLIEIFSETNISIKDFTIRDYEDKLKFTEMIQTVRTGQSEEKTEYQQFLETEMKKIMGENLEQEKAVDGYDISGLAKVATRIAFIIFSLLIIQVLIGRHFDRKKYFKN